MIARSLYYLYQLRRNLRLKPAALQEMQQKKLRAMIKHAYENVPFYHMKFNEAGIRPDDVKSIEDLAKVPVTTKAEIQASSLKDIAARSFDVNKCLKRTTSGSTGIPLTVFLDRQALEVEMALLGRTYFEDGLRLSDKMVRIADPENFPNRQHLYERFGILPTKYISIFDNTKRQVSMIEKYRPDVLRGYVSCVEVLADFCRENGKDINLRLVFTGAELLDKNARQLISSVFRADLFDLYVSVEFGLMGWECHEHSGYHVNVESVLFEFARNGEFVSHGEKGEMICTGLVNKALPLIRYKIDDIGVLSDDQCQCGIALPLIKIIEGRVGDFLVTTSGKIVPPTIFFPYPFEDVMWIKQFRIIQESRYRIVFEIIVKEGYNIYEDKLAAARARIKQFFGEDMEVIFKIVEKIKVDSSGKLRKVISKVPIDMAFS
jgi:phenylacetate-CoA ligase